MTKIREIWEELSSDKSFTTGLLFRRYSTAVLPDVFAAVQQPGNLKCIALRIRADRELDLTPYNNLKEVAVSLNPDDYDQSYKFLLIKLVGQGNVDVFATLCEDLIIGIVNISDSDLLIKELFNRFEKWRTLFDKAASGGLSLEEQSGLFGELFFLRRWLDVSINKDQCIHSWCGPERRLRDFQSAEWAIEIKATKGNNHQKIHVSSERQLDTSNLKSLFLYHISLEIRQSNGESLNQIVDSIFSRLTNDHVVNTQFKTKLHLAGYFIQQHHLYEDTGYYIRDQRFYLVNNEFPRIEEKDVRAGVGDVKYSIILSGRNEYLVDESVVFQTIK